MTDHDELRMSIGAYVLGNLDPEEHATVRAHLEQCAACRAELSELAPIAELVVLARGVASDDAAPSPLLEEAVLGGYARERRAGWWAQQRRALRRRSGRSRLLIALPGAAIVAAATLAVLIFAGGPGDGGSNAGGTLRVTLNSVLPGSENTATVRVTPTSSGSQVQINGALAPSRPGQVYEMWFVGRRGRVSAGTFTVGPDGHARLTLGVGVRPQGYLRIGITREPDARDPARNGPTVMAGTLSA